MIIERTIDGSVDVVNAMITSHCDSNFTMKAVRNWCYMLDYFGYERLMENVEQYFRDGLQDSITPEELVAYFGEEDSVNALYRSIRGEDDD